MAVLRRNRSEQLVKTNTLSQQTLGDDRAGERQASAGLASAGLKAGGEAGVSSAKAQVVDAGAAVDAAQATISSSTPRWTMPADRCATARVRALVATEGEVVSSGGRVLNLVVWAMST